MKVCGLERYLYNLKGKFNSEEGLHFGDAHREVKGIQVSWMATLEAIENACRAGANVMLVHETVFFPYPSVGKIKPEEYPPWPINQKRMELLSQYEISVIRFHGTLDEICIFDDFAGALELPQATIVERGLVKLYDIEPVTIEAMVKRVKSCLSLDSVRVTPYDLKKKIRRIGLPWGGLGLFVNVSYQERLLRHNPDLFIAGETDSYSMHFARDSGVAIIETSHEVSENIGLRNFTDRLRQEFKDIPVTFYENRRPWINR